MEYEKQLFENSKMQAPADFVGNTMKHIQLHETNEVKKETAKIEYSFVRLGQICVAAAVFLIVLNIFPATKTVYGQDHLFPIQEERLIEKISDKYQDFLDTAKQFIDCDKENN